MIREGRHCEQAFRSDMGRHYVLRTSYLRRVCRSYGAVFLRVVAKIIFRAWYGLGTEMVRGWCAGKRGFLLHNKFSLFLVSFSFLPQKRETEKARRCG